MRLVLDLQGAQAAARHAGLGRFTLELARALVRRPRGHQPLLLLNTTLAEGAAALAAEFAPAPLLRWAAPEGSAAGRDPQRPLRRAAALLRAEAVLAARPDALHLGSVFEGWDRDAVTTWPAEWQRPPTAATLHDLLPLSMRDTYLDGHWKRAGLVPWYQSCLAEAAACDLLLCNSTHTRGEALRFLPQAPAQSVVIGGAASPLFAPSDAPSPHPGCILFLGAGDPRKNEGALIRAFALLPPALRRVHPLAIGHVDAGHLRAQFAAAALGEGEAVVLPFIPDADLPALLSGAALVVIPSRGEGFGLPALEAMRCGAPVLVARAGALPDLQPDPAAQFDPDDAPALAALLQRWLDDAPGRAALAGAGRRRAQSLTWDAVADRAWDALEALAPRPSPRRKPSLALVAPLPPAPSGIADYAAELAEALAAHYALTLVSAAPPQGPLEGRFPFLGEALLPAQARRFDRVLVQMGNNPLHATALRRILPAVPAAVTLHDAFLDDLQHAIGGTARRAVEEGYPALFRPGTGAAPVLEAARLVLVHSAHAARLLRVAHGRAATAHVQVVPHLRAPAALPGRAAARAALGIAGDALVVASFGLATRRKCPALLMEAVAGIPGARLAWAGAALEGEVPAALPRTGRLSPEDYRRWLAAADVAVQLREEDRGETSGAALDALAAGVPLVCNAQGAFAEFPPGAVVLTDARPDAAALRAAILRAHARGGAAGRAWAREALAPARVAALLRDALEEAYAKPLPEDALRGIPFTAAEAAAAGLALARNAAAPREARVWLDMALEPASAVLEALREGGPGWRPEPCRRDGARLVTAHALAFARLGLPGPPPEDGPAAVLPGDALVTEDAGLRALALALGVATPAWEGTHRGLVAMMGMAPSI